jgi:RNA methyltransferase, TrmH family
MALTKSEISRLRSLREKKQREALGLFVVEGEKVVGELLAANVVWEQLLVTSSSRYAGRGDATVISDEEMARISHFPTPSSALGIGRIVRASLSPGELASGRTLALDRVQDAGNVGTLLRIADWFGFDRVLLGTECADLFSQKVINASMGSFSRVRVVTVDVAAVLADQPDNLRILGCDLQGRSVHELPPMDHVVVVIGSEGRGLSEQVARQVRERVTIPQYGRAESLNAAVAAGIVCARIRG